MTLHPGLILDSPVALSELPDFDILTGGDSGTKTDWHNHVPSFRSQGPTRFCTAFAGTAIASTFNHKETGDKEVFSASELYFRSGGSIYGNSLISTLIAMQRNVVLENDIPTTIPDGWGVGIYNRLKKQAIASEEHRERGKPFAIKSITNVLTTDAVLRSALKQSPLMVAIGIGTGYSEKIAPNPKKIYDYHAVVLLDIEDDGTRIIFDSLSFAAGFDGFHKLAGNYDILYAFASVDLPNDWYKIQSDAKAKPFDYALSHYGKPRNYYLELEKANLFRTVLRAHPTLLAPAGRLWTVLVNAICYGGYNVTDILNHLTNIRRTGKPIFDLNSTR